jgi:hypothetical protein
VLGLAGPDQLRVEVRIVLVLLAAGIRIGLRRNETDGRIVDAFFVAVVVLFYRAFFLSPLSLWESFFLSPLSLGRGAGGEGALPDFLRAMAQ